jgi:hypothetical protein
MKNYFRNQQSQCVPNQEDKENAGYEDFDNANVAASRDGRRRVDFICRHRHVDNTSSMSSMSTMSTLRQQYRQCRKL